LINIGKAASMVEHKWVRKPPCLMLSTLKFSVNIIAGAVCRNITVGVDNLRSQSTTRTCLQWPVRDAVRQPEVAGAHMQCKQLKLLHRRSCAPVCACAMVCPHASRCWRSHAWLDDTPAGSSPARKRCVFTAIAPCDGVERFEGNFDGNLVAAGD
jgi:hypothetical protein